MQRDHIYNKLRELGYTFRRDAPRVKIWKHTQTYHEVHVRNKGNLREHWVRETLRSARCSEEDIERFISAYKN